VKNITLSVDDEVYRLARRKAAERETSVSGLVRDYLNGLAGEGGADDPRKRSMNEILARVRGRVGRRVSRDDLHERQSFR
jgi:hypothetical protein